MTLIEYILSFKNTLTEQGDLTHENRYQIYHAINEQYHNQKLLDKIAIQTSLIDMDNWILNLQEISPISRKIYDFLIKKVKYLTLMN